MSSNAFGDDELNEYNRWRQNRWAEIAGPAGKASLIAHRLITVADQRIPEVPGRWTSTGSAGSLTLTATRAEGVSVDGQIVDGAVELTDANRLSFPGGRSGTIEELAGAHALAVRDPAAPTRVNLREIAAWPWDPAWNVEAKYRPAEAGRTVAVTRLAGPKMQDTFSASGDAAAVHYLRQWEARDYATMRSLCTDTATVWHNDGSGDQPIDENMALLRQLATDVDTLRYDIVRQFQDGDELLQQQVLHLTMTDGTRSEVHAAMYFRFDGGLIDRIEEYFNVVPLEAATPG